MNDLSRLGLGKTQQAGHGIDASGLGELCLREAQLAVLFAQLVQRLLFRLDAITAFDGVEVLQAIDHHEREEHGDRRRENAHLTRPHRV